MKYAPPVFFLALLLLLACASTARLKPASPGSASPPPQAAIPENKPAENEENKPPAAVMIPESTKSRDTIPPPAFKIDTLFTVSYGPCQGKCPVYRLSVTNDGMVFWNGFQHVERTGPHITRLNEEQRGKLEAAIGRVFHSSLQASYPGKDEFIPTFPMKTYTLKLNNQMKTIEVNHSPPRQLIDFERQLFSWLEKADWRPVPAR
ncbi:MAG TPA: DUF6438 domain-containing protein [Saprospiraceae bacterium]|nr:DUF6438 domain-containing protein [Saprospiraceae bacterium]HNT21957.1 DUF6438 domain-containing protein [Saprospiraceae bacterium]